MSDIPPLGPNVPAAPRGAPSRASTAGRWARLDALDADRHAADLWLALRGARSVWTYMADGPFVDQSSFLAWLRAREKLSDPLVFAVTEQGAGRTLGLLSLLAIRPEPGVAEVGQVLFSPPLQRTRAATEAIYLIMRRVFDELAYRRLEWKCDDLNAASKRAALRFGFRHEGLFRRHMIVKGRNRDTAWYAMIEDEWPSAREAMERWLSPDNFDDTGRQRASLASLRAR